MDKQFNSDPSFKYFTTFFEKTVQVGLFFQLLLNKFSKRQSNENSSFKCFSTLPEDAVQEARFLQLFRTSFCEPVHMEPFLIVAQLFQKKLFKEDSAFKYSLTFSEKQFNRDYFSRNFSTLKPGPQGSPAQI